MLASIHKAVFQFNSKVRPFQPAASETVWQSNSNYRLISTMGFPVLVRCHLYIESGPWATVCLCLQFSVSTCCVIIEQMSSKNAIVFTWCVIIFSRCEVLQSKDSFVSLCATVPCTAWFRSGPRFNIKMTPYQYRKSHCGDKTISRPSYLHNGISCTGKRTSLYWIGALLLNEKYECELFIA